MAGAGRRRVVFFPFPFLGHFNPVLRLAGALHARGLAVTVFHTEQRVPDPADYPADYRFVSLPVEVPPELVASEDIARMGMAMNDASEAPFRDRLAALLAEEAAEDGGVLCVITDVVWYSAQAVARELGVPALGIMTASAAIFRVYMAYQTLIDKAYLPVQDARKDDPVEELPPYLVKDLLRHDTSRLEDFAELLRHTVAGARQSSGLIINTLGAIEAANLERGSIKAAIGRMMESGEGREIRERMKGLKMAAEDGINELGSSHTHLSDLVALIKSF
ncbi:unnamed protein product [Triticum turgidum subsp. durum]|uniref:Glycosyltransferase n=1 Tax=Triticum turgidum subsp. durum TaxID=4567 RepID=A0A9R0ZRU3_TRITD|nr:unnamed protein product [Triticum turgidum subsp. durum]